MTGKVTACSLIFTEVTTLPSSLLLICIAKVNDPGGGAYWKSADNNTHSDPVVSVHSVQEPVQNVVPSYLPYPHCREH